MSEKQADYQTLAFCPICNASRYTDQIPRCPTCSKDGLPRYEVRYRYGAGTYSVFDRWATAFMESSELVALLNNFESENITMYGAILEASDLGSSAATRCKVELQRIARNDAKVTA